MEKKKIFLLIIILICIMGAVIFSKNRNTPKIEDINLDKELISDILYDDETDLYYIKNEKTGEIVFASENKDELQFYLKHPDYNPNPLETKKASLQDYMYSINEE